MIILHKMKIFSATMYVVYVRPWCTNMLDPTHIPVPRGDPDDSEQLKGNMKVSKVHKETPSPLTMVALVGSAIMLLELLVMVLLEYVLEPALKSKLPEHIWLFIDPLVLAVLISPVLYYWFLRPMREQQDELLHSHEQLRDANNVLERRVSERTLELMTTQDGLMQEIAERKRTEESLLREKAALNHSDALLREAEQVAHLGSWELDLASNVLTWSDEMFRIFELDKAMGPSYKAFIALVHPDERDFVHQAYTTAVNKHQPCNIVHRLLFADDRVKWVNECFITYFDVGGKPLRSTGTVQDITERELILQELRIVAAAFNTQQAILITDAEANIVRVNQAFQEITGYTAEEVIGRNPKVLSSGRHDKTFYKAMWDALLREGKWSGEIWDKRKNGEVYPKWVVINAVYTPDGKLANYVGSFSDITLRKEAEEEAHRLAFFDPLTHLPNRRLMLDRLQKALAASARCGCYGALMFLDLDDFKTINDTKGHDFGDEMLIEVANRLQHCVRGKDTVARLGGDEFVVMLENLCSSAQEAVARVGVVGEKILASLEQPYILDGYEFHASASIGATMFQGAGQAAEDFIRQADVAMYQAKAAGRNALRFFDPSMQHALDERSAIEADLRRALVERQFRLFYQAQVDVAGRLIGAEALMRWMHPQRGLVSPLKFIPLAEETGLILPIGLWVLETACAQLKQWENAPHTRELQLAVNVSARQFRQNDFVEQVRKIVDKSAIRPELLKLELTESLVLDNVMDTISKMHELKATGIRFSMDDFGTGYSSLAYLKQLPLDQLKIDQSFVRDIVTDQNDAVIVQTIIGMARNFHLNVIAEGVETKEQFEQLQRYGCPAFQGYLFSKPLPIEEFTELLAINH